MVKFILYFTLVIFIRERKGKNRGNMSNKREREKEREGSFPYTNTYHANNRIRKKIISVFCLYFAYTTIHIILIRIFFQYNDTN